MCTNNVACLSFHIKIFFFPPSGAGEIIRGYRVYEINLRLEKCKDDMIKVAQITMSKDCFLRGKSRWVKRTTC